MIRQQRFAACVTASEAAHSTGMGEPRQRRGWGERRFTSHAAERRARSSRDRDRNVVTARCLLTRHGVERWTSPTTEHLACFLAPQEACKVRWQRDSVGPAQPGRSGGRRPHHDAVASWCGRDRQGRQDAQCRQSAQPTVLRCGSAVDSAFAKGYGVTCGICRDREKASDWAFGLKRGL